MTGYRIWTARKVTNEDRVSFLLAGVGSGSRYFWTPGANTAVCKKEWVAAMEPMPTAHPVPGEGCECGFWMLDTVEAALLKFRAYQSWPTCGMAAAYMYGPPGPILLGAVQVWGTVRRHEEGNRCAHARIISLLLNENQVELSERLSTYYDVPLFRSSEELQDHVATF